MILEVFNCQKWETNLWKSPDVLGFQAVAKIDGWLQNYISYLIYGQIWLNFLSDRLSLFLHLCMDDSHLAIEQNILKETLRFRGEIEKEPGSQNYE